MFSYPKVLHAFYCSSQITGVQLPTELFCVCSKDYSYYFALEPFLVFGIASVRLAKLNLLSRLQAAYQFVRLYFEKGTHDNN